MVGTVSYPDLSCSGVLSLVSVTPQELQLTETITNPGPYNCIDINVTMDSTGSGTASWTGTGGGETETATLTRS